MSEEEEKPERESQWYSSVLKRLDDYLERCDRRRRRVSQWVGGFVYDRLNKLENISSNGLFFRRFKNWVRVKSDDRTFATVGKGFDDLSSIKGVFVSAFHFRFYLYIGILLAIGIIAFLHFKHNCSLSSPHLSIYGYLLNLGGTLILARGIFQGKRGLIVSARDSSQFIDKDKVLNEEPIDLDPEALILAAYNSVDAVWGAFYVVLGVFLQIIATLNWTIPIPQFVC